MTGCRERHLFEDGIENEGCASDGIRSKRDVIPTGINTDDGHLTFLLSTKPDVVYRKQVLTVLRDNPQVHFAHTTGISGTAL